MQTIWNDARIERVRELLSKNVDLASIASRLGVSPGAVRKMCRRRGIELPTAPRIDWRQGSLIERVRELAAQRVSASDIGKELGMSRGSVTGLCFRKGIKLCGDYKIPIRQSKNEEPKHERLPRSAVTPARTGTPKSIKRTNVYSLTRLWPDSAWAPPAPQPCTHVTLLDLDEDNHCRWIIGHPRSVDTVYCGAKRECPGLPSDKVRNLYCAYHHYIAHHMPPNPEDNKHAQGTLSSVRS